MTVIEKTTLIHDFILDALTAIEKVDALDDSGHVQIIGDLFVQETNQDFLGGLMGALVYTAAQLEACADYGLGVPSYTNGNGVKSSLISMKAAKALQIKSFEDHIANLKSLLV